MLLTLLIMVLGCTDTDDKDPDSTDCTQVFCTEEFRSITVSVTDSNNEPVALDEFEVLISENGEDITVTYSDSDLASFQSSGVYPLINDSYLDAYQNKELVLNFKGSLNNVLIVDREYTVAFDCCHVSLVEGDLEVELP